MNVGNIPHQVFPSMGYAITASSSGRASLPVAPGMVIYSNFKHVSGTPAPEGTQGVNISKLKILDTLIEQLSKMKGQASQEFGNLDKSDEKRMDVLIEQFHKQIKTAQNTGIYTPAAPATGALFSIAV
ncbi:MAG: hypothetical protein FWD28_04815 [Treponema sp.]|nr:hypothetical protein [Treponema sp.]